MELGDATATVCSCQEDLCNYATRALASPSVGLAVLLTAALLAQRLVEARAGERIKVPGEIKVPSTNPHS